MTVQVATTQAVTIVEIRATHDRNRLLGTYDPARHVLRLFHRGETITVRLDGLAADAKPLDLLSNVD